MFHAEPAISIASAHCNTGYLCIFATRNVLVSYCPEPFSQPFRSEDGLQSTAVQEITRPRVVLIYVVWPSGHQRL